MSHKRKIFRRARFYKSFKNILSYLGYVVTVAALIGFLWSTAIRAKEVFDQKQLLMKNNADIKSVQETQGKQIKFIYDKIKHYENLEHLIEFCEICNSYIIKLN